MAYLAFAFDHAFSSHLFGEIKPNEGAFLKVMEKLEVDADSLWFFDDSPLNVETAQRLGINAFLVDGFGALQRSLKEEGLIGGRHA